ncbi:hypothetical protein HID58_062517 [Brassica napus]|uniref:Uncharacterized protein n=1 Tax=Brassica napus TaxID=3708 RepID=A0ABQ8A1P0_BRANA|nr:hypothetical protein HID58_062517 [Brassica napus]
MGRGVRKESYRIYRSALKVRFPCQSRLCGLFSSDRRTLAAPYSTFVVPNSPLYYATSQGRHELYLLVESGVDIINLWNYRRKAIALLDTAFRVYNKCPQFLEPVEDALYEVINRASDGGITPLHVAAL